MATLHVRNLPDDLYERLRRRAREERRSISAEVISLLDTGLAGRSPSRQEILESVERRRSFRPADAGAPDVVTLLREDRER
jgi:plasmid stability protein